MKRLLLPIVAALSVIGCPAAHAATTISATNHFAYGANIGWLDCRADVANGAVIGEYICSGYLYAANIGWINLGDGTPANGIQYQNTSATDFGVNHDGAGNLRGYAYGANIGWINFEAGGNPKVDLWNGNLSGYAWSANCGWISLSNATAFVQTDKIAPGADIDGDGMADAWELSHTNTLNGFSASTDADGDGASDLNEYLAGTEPLAAGDYLRITNLTRSVYGPTYVTLGWTAVPTRFYAVQRTSALESNFTDRVVLGFSGGSNAGFDDLNERSFYRIRAFRPLMP